ncbi:hypothetical protein SAMN02745133_01966 [Desulforamulus putei DSM 12395]|uniref:Uncharacterized protein n=1 Tax=Desulforamulus putei DSM 12395 TaxID=1121429 RepID=A0A1M4ZDM5_9FIRM|nr:hypothetical protein [Desulforamulus putei]SHF16159.1 hypothetical protein SAMN02745133_01966 [Desulforamulus putei DSM 12395]
MKEIAIEKFIDRLDKFIKVTNSTYEKIERIRLELFELMQQTLEVQDIQDEYKEMACLCDNLKGPVVSFPYDGVTQITVYDYPARAVKKSDKYRNIWQYSISSALRKHDIKTISSALIIIRFFLPLSVAWDPDNRAINYVINGVKLGRLIKDDSWDKMSYMVIGGTDKENPRTEIWVYDLEKFDNKITIGRKEQPVFIW